MHTDPTDASRRGALASLCATLCLTALGGCAGSGREAERPSVQVAGLRPGTIGVFEQQMFVTLRITNPTDRDFVITGTSFDLELNGQSFARGVSGTTLDVPRMGTATVEVETFSGLSGVLKQIGRLTGSDTTPQSFRYRIRGRLLRDTGSSVRFDDSGALDLGGAGAGGAAAR
jgi:LEA14-like dessication related protein